MYSCLLCGVGGQGTVLASRLMAQAAMEKGYFARTAETIGMAQRGGCVVSHVRVAEGDIASSLIPVGGADVLVGFEPGEAVRCLKYLKPDGLAVVCKTPVAPVMAALKGDEYDADAMMEYLKANAKHLIVLDAEEIVRVCGTMRALNVALLGAVAASGKMPLTMEEAENALRKKIKPELLEINLTALKYGAGAKEE